VTEQTTLADLLREHQAETGDSYNDMARKTGLSKAKIGQLVATTAPHAPRLETLEKVATGLRLPLSAVKAAAMATAGISEPSEDNEAETTVMVSRYKQLPPPDQTTVRDLVNSLYRRATKNDG